MIIKDMIKNDWSISKAIIKLKNKGYSTPTLFRSDIGVMILNSYFSCLLQQGQTTPFNLGIPIVVDNLCIYAYY